MNTERDELHALWQRYDERLERLLLVNEQVLEKIETQKVDDSFARLVRFKIIMVVFGILWNAFLALCILNTWQEPFFVVSAGLSFIINTYAIIGYIRQVTMVRRLDLGGPVTDTQVLLQKLHISILQVTRVIWLSLPLYTTFYIKLEQFGTAGRAYWVVQSLVTTGAVVLAAWLYHHITAKNTDSRVVRSLIRGDGGRSISKAEHFISQIAAFRREEK